MLNIASYSPTNWGANKPFGVTNTAAGILDKAILGEELRETAARVKDEVVALLGEARSLCRGASATVDIPCQSVSAL